MTAFLWGVLSVLAALGMAAIGDMVSDEVRDRLDHLPYAILRLAARRLDPAHRAALYEEVWLPDLAYILKGAEARSVTRLVRGTWHAIGILTSIRRVVRNLPRTDEGGAASFGRPDFITPNGDLIYVKPHVRTSRDGRLVRVSGTLQAARRPGVNHTAQ